MQTPRVTIVVVPRERFSEAISSLESVYRFTAYPFELIYVDGCSPAPLRPYLAEAVRSRGFRLLRESRYLSPNQARNRGLALVDTPYVVFLDNDLHVSPGWLDKLVRCAEETGAWLVAPLYRSGRPGAEVIHMAGGEAHIEQRATGRYLKESHHLSEAALENHNGLQRGPTELIEFHCLLARTEALRALGGLDESLLSTPEHVDLCLCVREAGGEIYLEPSAKVTFVGPSEVGWSDLPYFLLRWSEDWARASLDHFRTKWDLADDDPYVPSHSRWITNYRMNAMAQWRRRLRRSLGRSVGGALEKTLEDAVTAWAAWK